ncbi:MAG: hypothetical protein RR212_12440 [Bacteroidales bacterium]
MNPFLQNVLKLFLTSFCFLCSPYVLMAKDSEVARSEFQKRFNVTEASRLMADNRHGSLTVLYGKNDELIVDVVIESKAVSQTKAMQQLKEIHVNMEQQESRIQVVTSVGSKMTNRISDKIAIHLTVTMPSKMQAELIQKYGRIQMPAYNEGIYRIEVKYGKLVAGDFVQPLSVQAAYSRVELGNATNLTLDMAYCDQASLGNLRSGRIDSKYSNTSIREVWDISIRNKYGNITINSLSDSLLVENLSYSSLKVKEIASGFRYLSVMSRYSNTDLWISHDASYTLRARDTRYSNCTLSKSFKISHEQKKGDFYEYAVVNEGNPGEIIFSGSSYSNFTIK